jgi:hypothetical protein
MGEKHTDVDAVSLGIRLGALPQSTVDTMFAGLSWEAERDHGLSVRAAVAATFASAKVEAEIMADDTIAPRDRLKAAQQFKEGFVEVCKMVCEPPKKKVITSHRISEDGVEPSVPSALAEMYGNEP